MGELEGRGRRCVIVPSPFQGHINPMLQLCAVLHSKGFSITIAHTQFNSLKPLNYPDYNFVSILDGLSDHDISSLDITALVLVVNAKCEVPFHECLAWIVQQQEKPDEIACVIYDELSWFAEAAAHNLKLPSIIFRTSNATTFIVRTTVIKFFSEGRIPLPDPMSEEPVQEHPPLRLRDLPISIFGPIDMFFKLITEARNIRRASAIIYNTINCLEGFALAKLQQQCQIPIFAIGPIHKIIPGSYSSLLAEDNSCISWLNKQAPNSVIYISLGSLVSVKEKEVTEMAWGLANSKQPFLWVIRPGMTHNSECTEPLPEGFKESIGDRGCIVKWAPQKEVLAHCAVGGFWTHCGWNSLMESICEGVPMICRPGFGDQKVSARYVSEVWKVGLQLENELERGEVDRVVRKLLVDKEGKEMRHRAMDLKNKAELCIREGGSSYKSLEKLVEFIISF